MERVELDDTAREILLRTLASPKTPGELARILDLSGAIVLDYLELLERLNLVRVVLSFWARDGKMIRYYEAELPLDVSDLTSEEAAAL